jgi:RNA polymerase sigma-70 factor (ECF subfamily)
LYQKEGTASSPEKSFDHAWASALVKHCQDLLEEQYRSADKGELAGLLLPHLLDGDAKPHREIAEQLSTTTSNVQVMLHRLRRKYRDILQREVRATLADPAELKDEIRFLLSALD